MTDKINGILQNQREITKQLEELANADTSLLNRKLTQELELVKKDNILLQEKYEKLGIENRTLKNTLYEQMNQERISIIASSRKKHEDYFRVNAENGLNELAELESSISNRIAHIKQRFSKEKIEIENDIFQRLEETEQIAINHFNQMRHLRTVTKQMSQREMDAYEQLQNQVLTEDMILAKAKKNNFERLIGLNIINKIGIFLIVLGVIFSARYTYIAFNDSLRSIFIFALGLLLLGAGELTNRKKPNVFSLGLTAAGVSITYIGIAVSYFLFHVFTMYPAIIMCIVATLLSLALSIRYKAEVILAFSLIGGYLPIFAISNQISLLSGLLIYFIILNLLALLIAFKHKWIVTTYIGLVFNMIASITVIVTGSSYSNASIVTLCYLFFAFATYILIPTVGTYTGKTSFKTADIILMGFNTVIASMILISAFYYFNLEDYVGIFAMFFALVYFLLANLVEKKFLEGRKTSNLFYITSFTFIVLIIPFQFDIMWFSLGWLCEGVVVTIYGLLGKDKRFKNIGLVITSICLLGFVNLDIFMGTDSLFPYKFLAITLGLFAILYTYIKTKTIGFDKTIVKISFILSLWAYINYMCIIELNQVMNQYTNYIGFAMAIILSYVLGYILTRLEVLYDKISIFLSNTIYIWTWLSAFILNFILTPFQHSAENETFYFWLGTLLLILLFLFTAFTIYNFTQTTLRNSIIKLEVIPFILTIYLLIYLTQILVFQYELHFSNYLISIIYVMIALGCIIFGFIKRFSYQRKMGLVLSIITVTKLFIIDLARLTEGYRIISYFALGISLVAISFVYQYFSKRLELEIDNLMD